MLADRWPRRIRLVFLSPEPQIDPDDSWLTDRLPVVLPQRNHGDLSLRYMPLAELLRRYSEELPTLVALAAFSQDHY